LVHVCFAFACNAFFTFIFNKVQVVPSFCSQRLIRLSFQLNCLTVSFAYTLACLWLVA